MRYYLQLLRLVSVRFLVFLLYPNEKYLSLEFTGVNT